MATHLNSMDSMKAEIDSQIAKGDTSGIWKTFEGFAQAITSGITGFGRDPQVLEIEVHFLWYILIQGARNLSPESLGQYHILHTLLYIREFGTLSQTTKSGKNTVEVGNKKLWTDLPYLFDDVEAAWRASDTNMTKAQRGNFVAFLAKMLAVGICGDDLAGLVQNSIDGALGEASTLPQIESLQKVLTWFTYAGDKITIMSNESFPGTSLAGWALLQEKLADLTAGVDAVVALLAMEAYLKMYACLWRTENPMRPARNSMEDQQAHVAFLGAFCDRFPDLAKPEWKKFVQDLRDN